MHNFHFYTLLSLSFSIYMHIYCLLGGSVHFTRVNLNTVLILSERFILMLPKYFVIENNTPYNLNKDLCCIIILGANLFLKISVRFLSLESKSTKKEHGQKSMDRKARIKEHRQRSTIPYFLIFLFSSFIATLFLTIFYLNSPLWQVRTQMLVTISFVLIKKFL